MSSNETKFVVITPVRDEEAHLEKTINCVTAQTILPVEWVIVDDGSRDHTGAIIDEYARRHSWITPVHRRDRGFRKPGGGVVDAFNDGYSALKAKNWDFIVKLDGDLSFAPDYFERCFEQFRLDQRLGVGGGVICHNLQGREVVESNPAFHVRGATKIYRRVCWEAIGGFWPAPGWDTMDEVRSSMLGWTSRSFPELRLMHYRPTGTAEGAWAGWVKNGRANYICGYHPLFMFAKCILRVFQKPYITGSAGLACGYLSGYVKRIPRVDDSQAIHYLRRQQLRRLIGAESIWK